MFTSDEVIHQKQGLRAELRARRAQLNESQRARASWLLCDQLWDFLKARGQRTVGVYLARPFEISLDGLIGTLIHNGYRVAAPRLDMERQEMTFWRLCHVDEVETGPWQVRQPPAVERIEDVSLVIVPGLAFDAAGGRLGTGGGWYDRTLRATDTLIGVGFDCQIVAQVPHEAHDLRMNIVASDARWIDVNGD